MSHSYYNKQWQEAQAALVDLLQQENPPEPPKPERDRLAAFQLLATMYIKYIQIFRKLEQSYDQVVHPQKRRVLRHCLDGVMGRIVELKHEMMNLEFSEYHYFDDVLSDLKLTPNDVEIPVPKYFINERAKNLKEREKLLGQVLAKIGPQDGDKEKEEIRMPWEQAIRIIQIHERARQGRLRAKFMREIRQQEDREKQIQTRGPPTLDPDVAAMRIQKIWKGFAQRRRTKKERDEEMIFIGMAPPPLPTNTKNLPQTFAVKTEELRRKAQDVHEHEFQQALVNIRENIVQNEGPDLKEGMMDQIRQWFIECRDASGKFPEYPDEDDGGSAMIFKEKDPAELEKELSEKDDGKAKGKKGKKDKKDKKDKKKDKKGKKGKKGGDDDEEEEGWKMAPSNFVPAINDASDTFKGVWATRDETENFPQKHDSELIKEEKRKDVETEIRLQVDELMRAELANLKAAVDREKKGKKGKKSGKKKKKKGKKSGKKGKKGKKKEKDLTPDR
ncbi:IQ and AAA domain-containing protein 1 [Elysia marginata]|uniref:IQ and AAA domain-containing protein 1 n=1 Tax=Elysia marginata TaxID=1093978 RepID=A0AAV4G6U1_9GAST|nr:IQ and AAA domain-containing protein 1 [Elysia marginata]